ncbi:FHIPEP family type III secretion protein [Achromobacter insuavis]
MNRLSQWLAGNRDIVMVLVVMGVLIVLFMPIPPAVLDFLILANFSFAFLILLLTFYMTRPVEFSTFPSLLLIATLFRLSLNVAATRLILSEANAGSVISAIGGYVVGELRHWPHRIPDPDCCAVRGGDQRRTARLRGRGALHAGQHARTTDEYRR